MYYNHTDVVKLLLEAGADVMAVDRHKRLPLHKAAMGENNDKIVKALLAAVKKNQQVEVCI